MTESAYCKRCNGQGKLDSERMLPWNRPGLDRVKVRMGLIHVVPCPKCQPAAAVEPAEEVEQPVADS